MRQIVVTGGGTGIGRAVAAAFVAAGDQVVITGRRAALLDATAAEIGARGVAFDASDPAQIEVALPTLPDRVDVLVNNAGGNTDIVSTAPEGLAGLAEGWLANYTANVLTAVLVTEALAPRFNPGGSVITLSSIAAHRGGSGSYGAAKAAAELWNLTVAQELGPRGVTANMVAPGFIEGTEFFGDRMTGQRRANLIGQTLDGRPGAPDNVAAAVLFLASAAARHITAQTLHVNGGAYAGR